MKNTFVLISCLAMASATAATAQGFTGGSIELTYNDYADIDELQNNVLTTSAQFAFTPQFSIAVDVTNITYTDIDFSFGSASAHAIYDVNPEFAVGAFTARDSFPGLLVNSYGAEVAYNAGPFGVESYLGTLDLDGEDATLFGLAGNYAFGNGFSVIAEADVVDFSEFDTTSTNAQIGAAYMFASGASVHGSFGTLILDDGGSSEEENYFSIGASIGFGPEGGTTFGERSLFTSTPIFLF